MDKKYTVSQVAKRLGVSNRTILREIKRGKINVEKVGRRYLIPEKTLKFYLEQDSEDLVKNIQKFIRKNKQDMIVLLQRMVSMASDTNELGQEGILANYIKSVLDDFGIRSVLYKQDDAVAVRGSFGYADGGILLDCPLDTTPAGDIEKWQFPPYEGVINGGRIYGRGTADCKAGIVAMIYAVLALKKYVDEEKIRVELVFDGGEQDGSYKGMKLTLKRGLPVKAGIIGYAGTGNQIAIGCRGYHRFKLKSLGHSVHTGARYKAGVNAIVNMAALVTDLEHVKFPKPKNKYFKFGSKLTFSKISGGRAINIVPDECEALLDVRTVPSLKRNGVEKILKRVVKSAQLRYKGFDVKYEYLLGQEGYVLDESEAIITSLKDVVREVTNKNVGLIVHGPAHIGTLLYKEKIPVIVWGPDGGNIHSYDEYIEINSLPVTSVVYANAILKYFRVV
jgi:succinyl-diaminopimelate desuccinylase